MSEQQKQKAVVSTFELIDREMLTKTLSEKEYAQHLAIACQIKAGQNKLSLEQENRNQMLRKIVSTEVPWTSRANNTQIPETVLDINECALIAEIARLESRPRQTICISGLASGAASAINAFSKAHIETTETEASNYEGLHKIEINCQKADVHIQVKGWKQDMGLVNIPCRKLIIVDRPGKTTAVLGKAKGKQKMNLKERITTPRIEIATYYRDPNGEEIKAPYESPVSFLNAADAIDYVNNQNRRHATTHPKSQTALGKLVQIPIEPIEETIEDLQDLQEQERQRGESIYRTWKPSMRFKGIEHDLTHPASAVTPEFLLRMQRPKPPGFVEIPSRTLEKEALSALQLESLAEIQRSHRKRLRPFGAPPGEARTGGEADYPQPEEGFIQHRDRAAATTPRTRQERERAKEIRNPRRCGYMLGDGTGMGKGRVIAALIATELVKAQEKRHPLRAIWVSDSKRLLEDARRDWEAIGGHPEEIQLMPTAANRMKFPTNTPVLFASYERLRAFYSRKENRDEGDRRMDLFLDWLAAGRSRSEASPVIVLDECQNLSNVGGVEAGGRAYDARRRRTTGEDPGSLQGHAGWRLQKELPSAKVLYTSATAFSNTRAYAYAERLGLWWSQHSSFEGRNSFIKKLNQGGIAALEITMRELVREGIFNSRRLDMHDVEQKPLIVETTQAQKDQQNTWHAAWTIVHAHMEKAIHWGHDESIIKQGSQEQAATQRQEPERDYTDEEFEQIDSSLAQIPRTRLAQTRQELHEHLVMNFKSDALIESMERDIREGRAPVVQIASTHESSLQRKLQRHYEIEGAGWPLGKDFDTSPKENILALVKEAFPIHQLGKDGKPKLDSQGRRLIRRASYIEQQAAIEELRKNLLPDTLLDKLIWHFGERIAEVTGRSQRIRIRPDGERVLEARPPGQAEQEAREFQDGKRQALVFSSAGATGHSYHADRDCGNPGQRVHYVVQMAAKTEALVQGIGRTHRTNQTQAPIIRITTTDIPGEVRLLTGAIKKIERIGAASIGHRKAFSEQSLENIPNYESAAGRNALQKLYGMIWEGKMPGGFNEKSFHKASGISIADIAKHQMQVEDIKQWNQSRLPYQQLILFLNRIMTMHTDDQEAILSSFDRIFKREEQKLIERDRLGGGIENMQAERIHNLGCIPIPPQPRPKDQVIAETTAHAIHIIRKLGYRTGREFRNLSQQYQNILNTRNPSDQLLRQLTWTDNALLWGTEGIARSEIWYECVHWTPERLVRLASGELNQSEYEQLPFSVLILDERGFKIQEAAGRRADGSPDIEQGTYRMSGESHRKRILPAFEIDSHRRKQIAATLGAIHEGRVLKTTLKGGNTQRKVVEYRAFLTGAILPVWSAIRNQSSNRPQLARFLGDEQEHLGIAITPGELIEILRSKLNDAIREIRHQKRLPQIEQP